MCVMFEEVGDHVFRKIVEGTLSSADPEAFGFKSSSSVPVE